MEEDRVPFLRNSILPHFKSARDQRNLDRPDGSHVIVSHLISSSPIEALSLLSHGISLCTPPPMPQRQNVSSIILAADCLSLIFKRLNDSIPKEKIDALPKLGILYFKETFNLLWQVRSMVEISSYGSKIAALMMVEIISKTYYDFAKELSQVLLFFPWMLFNHIEGVKKLEELMNLIKQECDKSSFFVDGADLEFRDEIITMIESIDIEVFPESDRIEKLFERLGIVGFEKQVSEIKLLELEIGKNRKSLEHAIRTESLVNLVRHCKCVFFGNEWPNSEVYNRNPSTDWIFPTAARCPITKAVMRNPVMTENGQAYDKANIERWLNTGNTTCPVTGETVVNPMMTLMPAQKMMIGKWSEDEGIELIPSEKVTESMVAIYLVEKLSILSLPFVDQSLTIRIINYIKSRASSSQTLSACIGKAGAFPIFLSQLLLLNMKDPIIQENAMDAIYILADEESNKKRIMMCGGGFGAIFHVLGHGLTWEARGIAASTMYRLSANEVYRRQMKRVSRLVEELVRMMNEGPADARRRALAGILTMGSEKDKLREMGLLVNACESEREVAMVVLGDAMVRKMLWEIGRTGRSGVSKKLRKNARILLELCSLWSCSVVEEKEKEDSIPKAKIFIEPP
ncbi:U-box domain-containing protein 16-like [Tasmannia lanceolata]|uniref:U-box domain-containing protein 16-like n=1 Tax=Tasmannia lanceolata TaxID=3420 RepID=UPI004062EDEB